MPQLIDTLIDAKWVIPVDSSKLVLEKHSVAINDGAIIAVLPTKNAHLQFSAYNIVQLEHHALLPGLVNLHTHAAMSLMRGQADDVPLMAWLNEHIWPTESRQISEEFVYDGTLLACGEMLRSGITFANDMYFFPNAAARAFLESGIRASLGLVVFDMPTAYANDIQDYFEKGLAARDEFRHEAKLSFCMAPHAPYTLSDKSLTQTLTYAEQLDLPIHIHLHETREEIGQSEKQFSIRPIERLRRIGLIGPRLIAVHCVYLNDGEIELFARQNCNIAHCPSSNLKLASGIAPIAKLTRNKVNVGLGTDSAASNNRLDIFSEMRLAALLGKVEACQADVLPAHQILEMATIKSARALGLQDKIGSITVGKFADLVAIDFSSPELTPCYDPISHLVYAIGREHVSHVWVGGDLLVDQGRLTKLDRNALCAKAIYWQNKISEP